MKMKRIILYLFVIFSSALILSSCSVKKKEEKLQGSWEYVWLSKNDSNAVIQWTFADQPLVEQVMTINGISETLKGNYFVEKKKSKFFIIIDDLYTWLDGKYRIIQLNEDFLIIQRITDHEGNYAFDRFEFVKVK